MAERKFVQRDGGSLSEGSQMRSANSTEKLAIVWERDALLSVAERQPPFLTGCVSASVRPTFADISKQSQHLRPIKAESPNSMARKRFRT
jgi:hypothetical protein